MHGSLSDGSEEQEQSKIRKYLIVLRLDLKTFLLSFE
jgi:hypothetical protein